MSLTPRHIVIDLTPLQPGGVNGGAKPLTLTLIRTMARLRPRTRFTWLTLDRTFQELRDLATPNVAVHCTNVPPGGLKGLLVRCLRAFGISAEPAGDLLFCPFTAPFFAGKAPIVSIIYDLQYRAYPDFFSADDRAQREEHARTAVRKAVRLVVSSSFVRDEALKYLDASPAQVTVIPHTVHHRFGTPDRTRIPLGLAPRSYFVYPANYWPHKNHKMLLVALSRLPEAKLILTGQPGEDADEIASAIAGMGLSGSVIQAGFLRDDEFAALLGFARALVFPSLYEGFGMPVLEAMQLGVPVLCSNTTCLPEVTGDGALLFDPRRPDDIHAALKRFLAEPDLAFDLTQRGLRRASEFGNDESMAERYFAVFDEAVSAEDSRSSAK